MSACRLLFLLWAAAYPGPFMSASDSLPQGGGLAARYPGDKGIAGDPQVIFADSFESDRIQWDGSVKRPPTTGKPGRAHSGQYAAELTVPPGEGRGAGMVKWFDPGYDRVYARWYVQFPEDYDQGDLHHAGGNLVGMHNHWLLGVAGIKPDGTDRFSTGLEPWRDWKRNPPPGELFMYTYYPDMKRDPDGNYWGNMFRPEKKFLLKTGKWYCLEMMVKVNRPDRADGEQAFWVDGKPVGHFTGIRWRTVEALKVNGFWLMLYIHDNPKTNTVRYDDVVVSRAYIGPMKANKSARSKPSRK
ncbi:MAG: hypothetical protein IT210_20610 [Armatimonadetes bacterium]|nr:hypothetical protein [Armatimonadota bacterium]